MAVFYRTDLTNSVFTDANMKGTVLFGSNLSGADLSDAENLEQSQLKHACGDKTTRLPEDLSIAMCSN